MLIKNLKLHNYSFWCKTINNFEYKNILRNKINIFKLYNHLDYDLYLTLLAKIPTNIINNKISTLIK
jgi:hypothetical protein